MGCLQKDHIHEIITLYLDVGCGLDSELFGTFSQEANVRTLGMLRALFLPTIRVLRVHAVGFLAQEEITVTFF